MNITLTKLLLLSSVISLYAGTAANSAFAQDESAVQGTADQAQQTLNSPPDGELAAKENSGTLDTHLRLVNEGITASPGSSLTLIYQTAPNSVCTMKSESTELRTDDPLSQMADRHGRVVWHVNLNSSLTGSDIPFMVSSSHFGNEERIESRIPIKIAVKKKTTTTTM